MKIKIELTEHSFFEPYKEENYKLLKEIPNVEHNDYFGKVLIIDGVSYTPSYYMITDDILVVGIYDDNTEGLYITTDYKERLETFQESEPTCPVCGQTFSDAFELDDEAEIDCPNCYAQLSVERVVDVSYSTALISKGEVIDLEEEGGEEQWKKLITHPENTHALEI